MQKSPPAGYLLLNRVIINVKIPTLLFTWWSYYSSVWVFWSCHKIRSSSEDKPMVTLGPSPLVSFSMFTNWSNPEKLHFPHLPCSSSSGKAFFSLQHYLKDVKGKQLNAANRSASAPESLFFDPYSNQAKAVKASEEMLALSLPNFSLQSFHSWNVFLSRAHLLGSLLWYKCQGCTLHKYNKRNQINILKFQLDVPLNYC